MAKNGSAFTASDLKTGGAVLDAARNGMVTITRRSEVFVLMRRSDFEERLAEAADPAPKTLDDMLYGYDRDAGKAALLSWMAEGPEGGELL